MASRHRPRPAVRSLDGFRGTAPPCGVDPLRCQCSGLALPATLTREVHHTPWWPPKPGNRLVTQALPGPP